MSDLDAIERRLQLLEDERELRNVLARYSFNADLGREREYADLYTEDGAIDLQDLGLPRYQGRETIYGEFITDPGARALAGRTQHHAAPTVFHIDGDEATGEGYSIMLCHNDDGSIDIPHANYSHWTFRRVDGEWKIVERDIRLIGSRDAAAMFPRTRR
jgi:hypothetical protein